MDDIEMRFAPNTDPLLHYPEERKITKQYASCERATKGLLRCLDTKRYKMKIGPECMQFCLSHIVEAISNLIDLIFRNPWYIEYWDDTTNRWEREFLHTDNDDEFALSFEDAEEQSMYSIVAFVEDRKENESGAIDFEKPFHGNPFRSEEDIQSSNIQNIVAHFLQRYRLQPMRMWFQATPSWGNAEMQRRFTFEDNGDEHLHLRTAPFLVCGTTKIPASIELDSLEDQDGPYYWFNIMIPIDFSG